ncbi:MAG TPA: uroporphyrinogen-III C-methyltransferase, partial [Terriglobales bacterium]
RLLQSADVVLHDDLVSPEILREVSPSAQLRNVGKRSGKKATSQQEINFLMIALAGSGLQVVRLKSGDPMIFGRLAEEIDALRRAGIDFEIVPGVTAAFGAAASAQIALTDRRISPALVLLAGHRASENHEEDWRKFVSSGATLVIYMPGHDYTQIATRLQNAGLRAATPCAIISRATTPHEKSLTTTVGDLPRASLLPAPALLVVGTTVGVAQPQALDPSALWDLAGLQPVSGPPAENREPRL